MAGDGGTNPTASAGAGSAAAAAAAAPALGVVVQAVAALKVQAILVVEGDGETRESGCQAPGKVARGGMGTARGLA